MGSRHERKIVEGAGAFLEPGEDVLAAIVASPRGHSQRAAGVRPLGAIQQRRVEETAEQVGVRLTTPMALAVTRWRLLTLRIGSPIGLGIGGKVKELLSAVPLTEVESIEVKRLVLGKTLTLTVRGVPIVLEANAAASASDLADAFARAKTEGRERFGNALPGS
jgi:hypothetical protein